MKIKLHSSKQKRKYALIRWIVFVIMLLFSFLFSTTGTFLKPLIFIPLIISISMKEKELISAFLGVFSGILADISFGKLLGFSSIIFICICLFTSLIFTHFLRQNFFNFIIINAFLTFIYIIVDYIFYYNIWNYENINFILNQFLLPSFLLTIIFSIFIYPIINKIRKLLTIKKVYILEENDTIIND